MKYAVILFILIGFVFLLSLDAVYAMPPFDSQEIFDFSNTIVVGKVIYVNSTFSPSKNVYHIEVEKFLKNPQDLKIILAAGQNVVSERAGNPVFNTGDRVLFFLTNSTVGHDAYSGILWVHPLSKLVESEWDRCNIFEKDISQDHWVLGGSGPTPKIFQGSNSDIEIIKNNEMATISYDVSNISDTRQEFGLVGTLSRSNGTAFETISNMSQHVVLDPCTVFKTIEWKFIPEMTGSYLFEINGSNSGTSYGLGFTVKEYVDSPLKQFKSGIPLDKITCMDALVLVIKSSNNFPACVTPETSSKLVERGWAKSFS